ncbi:hypothetical protein BDV93DRAFT_612289 [Ceratobasidium sp. AG-I]|nr:hypothetical protein BDV93DRAFT_612289 [Ceratobasidium sp. AG-I]
MPHWTHVIRELCSDWGLADAVWGFLYIMTLGFNEKYRDRLTLFESLDPAYRVPQYVRYSEPASFLGVPYVLVAEESTQTTDVTESGSIKQQAPGTSPVRFVQYQMGESLRSKQGAEWDKLSTASSVITATSAAALAIPSLAGPGSYWMVNAFFCAAFGVSLEGLLLVTYITVIAAGASDETLGLLARGKLRIFGGGASAKPTALIMALPVIFATYSSLLLLIGTVIMVINSAQPIQSDNDGGGYRILSLVPVGIGLFCMLCVVLVCEVGTFFEFRGRRAYDKKVQEKMHDKILATSALVGAAVVPYRWVLPQLSIPDGQPAIAQSAIAMSVLPSSFVGTNVVRKRDTIISPTA